MMQPSDTQNADSQTRKIQTESMTMIEPSGVASSSQPHEEEEELPLESNISKKLSDRTTKIVIILVLAMLGF